MIFLFCVISLGVSKGLVHKLPRTLGRASTPHSVVGDIRARSIFKWRLVCRIAFQAAVPSVMVKDRLWMYC